MPSRCRSGARTAQHMCERVCSDAVQVGRTVYVSGQLGTNASGALVGADVESQTRQALVNMSNVLATLGTDMKHGVCACTHCKCACVYSCQMHCAAE